MASLQKETEEPAELKCESQIEMKAEVHYVNNQHTASYANDIQSNLPILFKPQFNLFAARMELQYG